MSVTATILLLISAFTHAGWNFISKKEHPSQAFFLVSNTIGVICVFPILFYFHSRIPLVPPSVWIMVVMGGIVGGWGRELECESWWRWDLPR